MEEEKKEYGIRKINNKNWYKVYKNGVNGKTYYKILLSQKDSQGNTKNYYQNISFAKKLTPPNDGEQIRLISFIENIFGDDIYNPRYTFTITDFELRQTQEQKENQAFDEYNQVREQFENESESFDEELPF